ncbi:Kinase-like protein [Mycena kentingensis (nom. inval.)]|nr:Kinase-like protein [Mycena kentingensis (nom. inval.)]
MRRFFGRDTARANTRPTPFLQTAPTNGSVPRARSPRQTWAPVETVANHTDIHELVHRIRFLASMGSEDRHLVLDMCDRASTEAAAREAVRALMHEFKHGSPDAQLSAARLWAILLRNSSAAFIAQSTSSDFLDAVGDLLACAQTSPVVRHRVLRVLGDAVWNNPTKDAFRRLWLVVKPAEEPEEGSPYSAYDAILRSTATARARPARLGVPPNTPTSPVNATDLRLPLPTADWDIPPPSYELATAALGLGLRSSWVYSPRPSPSSATAGSSSPRHSESNTGGHLSYANTDDFILDISPAHSPTVDSEFSFGLGRDSGDMEIWSTRARASGSIAPAPAFARQSWDGSAMVLNVRPPTPVDPVEEWRTEVATADFPQLSRDEVQESMEVEVESEEEVVVVPQTPRRTPAPTRVPVPAPVPSFQTLPAPLAIRARRAPTQQPRTLHVPAQSTIPPIAQTPIRRRPLVQTENHSPRNPNRSHMPGTMAATMPASSSGRRTDGENAKQARCIYNNTLAYLKDVAWNEDDSGSLIKLSSFSKAISKLSAISSLVFALQYKELLVQISHDLQVAEHPKLKAAFVEDHASIADRLLAILYSPTEEEAVLALEDEAAQSFLDIVQFTLDHALLHKRDANSRARRLISKLARSADKLPTALIISGVEQRDEHPSFCGGFGDVFRAMHQGRPVALKHMRRFQGSDQRDIRKKFCREALVWQRLRHPFVVPLIGIDMESFPTSLCMVSPWMRNGTVINYLKAFQGASRRTVVNRLIREIAQGLAFLHDQNVVHGDLRGSNILVDDDGHASLTDFGLTVLSDATTQSQTQHGAGSVRWMAPETLNPPACGLERFARTTASDIYAFACVCLELFTGWPPFHEEILHDAPVILQVMEGARPARPPGKLIPDHVWEIMQESWSHNFADRPTILGIVLQLAMHERLEAQEVTEDVLEAEMLEDGDMSSASDEPMEIEYDDWVSSAIAPLDEFIDRTVNPRQRFAHMREIAEGSSGTVVYEAHFADDPESGEQCEYEPVAIRSVPIDTEGSKLGEILHEMEVMRDVPASEHILRTDAIYVDTVDDALWVQTELANRTLASVFELIAAGLRVSDRVIAGCARDILVALEHLRRSGLALGNLSPWNILLTNDGVVKLADFSSATTHSSWDSTANDDACALGRLIWELAAGLPLPPETPPPNIPSRSSPLHDFIRLCLEPEPNYSRLLETQFIKSACPRLALEQLLGHCTMLEIQHA